MGRRIPHLPGIRQQVIAKGFPKNESWCPFLEYLRINLRKIIFSTLVPS
jgi:hypothetical protein